MYFLYQGTLALKTVFVLGTAMDIPEVEHRSTVEGSREKVERLNLAFGNLSVISPSLLHSSPISVTVLDLSHNNFR